MKFLTGLLSGIVVGAVVLWAALRFSAPAHPGMPAQDGAPSSAAPTAKIAPAPARPPGAAPAAMSTLGTAQRARAAGHYVLDSEIPWLRDRISQNDEAALAAMMRQAGPEYERLFTELGLNEASRTQLLHHLALIYREKREVKLRQTSLARAQSDFATQLKNQLGPEKYAEYLAYEEFDGARRESAQLAEFARSSGQPAPDAARLADLQEMINSTAAYSARTINEWGGAFHTAAAPIPGSIAEQPMLDAAADLEAASAALMEEARRRGFTPAEQETLQRYYRREVDYYARWIADSQDPIGAQIRAMERRVLTMSADSRTKPADLERVKHSLELLRTNRPDRR